MPGSSRMSSGKVAAQLQKIAAPQWLLLASLACGGSASSRDREHPSGDSAPTPPPAPALGCPDGTCPPGAAASELPPDPRSGPDDVCGPDSIQGRTRLALSQIDLDELAGCERLASSLAVKLFQGLDVTPLRSLRSIDGTLTIYGDRAPDTPILEGFAALEQVGGLHLYETNASSLAPLAQLRRIGRPEDVPLGADGVPLEDPEAMGDLLISGCSQLSSLDGLSALERVDSVNLVDNSRLSSVAGLARVRVTSLSSVNCPLTSLEGIAATRLQQLNITGSALRDLSGLGDAPALQSLYLSTNSNLSSLAGMRAPERLDNIQLGDNPLTDLRGLAGLKEVGTLSIAGELDVSLLTDLEGLESLQRAGNLSIANQSRLISLKGLEGLLQVETLGIGSNLALTTLGALAGLSTAGQLLLSNMPRVTSLPRFGSINFAAVSVSGLGISALTGLENATISVTLEIRELSQLASLDGLPRLSSSAIFDLQDVPVLSSLTALAGIEELNRLVLVNTGVRNLDGLSLQRLDSLVLQGNPQLTQVDALAAVAGVQNFTVSNNPALRSLPSFTRITSSVCDGCYGPSVDVSLNPVLEFGPGFPALEQAGFIRIESNPLLTSLPGLGALRSINSLSVTDNQSLNTLDLSSLQQASSILIRGNLALDDAPFARLKVLDPRNVKIVSNASGPAALSPCPWISDDICDEFYGDCAPGSDLRDCGGVPL
jgi:hypothetical protein